MPYRPTGLSNKNFPLKLQIEKLISILYPKVKILILVWNFEEWKNVLNCVFIICEKNILKTVTTPVFNIYKIHITHQSYSSCSEGSNWLKSTRLNKLENNIYGTNDFVSKMIWLIKLNIRWKSKIFKTCVQIWIL